MIYEAITIIAVPIVRGVAGWAEKALADGEVTPLEYKQLAETVLRIGVPAAALCYGFKLPVEFSVAIPVVVDYVYHYVNKVLKKNKSKK